MNNIKFLLVILMILLISSCGKKEESEYIDQPDKQAGDKQQTNQNVQEEKKEPPKQNTEEPKTESKRQEETKTRELIPEKTITALEAGDYVGKVVTVKGFVAEVHQTQNVEYLNFIEKFPSNPFSGVIFKNKFDEFGDINIYLNKNVELTGLVSTYKGKPQIVMDTKSQIKISK